VVCARQAGAGGQVKQCAIHGKAYPDPHGDQHIELVGLDHIVSDWPGKVMTRPSLFWGVFSLVLIKSANPDTKC
jgi:hypothetical protein